jgi:hypothetical protein
VIESEESLDLNQQLGRCTESFDPMGQDAASITDPFGCFPKRRLSRYCHGSREKNGRKSRTKSEYGRKLALVLYRNCLILLGKHPLR